MQAEQAPCRVLEPVQLLQERGRQLLASDHAFKCLVHVEGGSDELSGAHGTAVGQFDPGGAAILDDDVVDIDLRLESAAGGDEGLHQAARQIE